MEQQTISVQSLTRPSVQLETPRARTSKTSSSIDTSMTAATLVSLMTFIYICLDKNSFAVGNDYDFAQGYVGSIFSIFFLLLLPRQVLPFKRKPLGHVHR